MQDKLKKLGLSRTGEVGKKIGGYLYFHKSYLGRFAHLDIESFAAYLPADFEYHIIKVGKNTVSFISCPTFDELEEPIVGASVQVDDNGNTRFTPQASNPLLYHHRGCLWPTHTINFALRDPSVEVAGGRKRLVATER